MSDPNFDPETILAGMRQWVEIESPTYTPAAVNRCMDAAQAALEGIGGSTERIPGRDGIGDIVKVRLPGEKNGPGILVLGHLDTVHEIGALAGPLRFRREGDRVYGPGILDMKGGNYAAYWALRQLYATGSRPKLPVTFMLIPDEEVGSPTSRDEIEAEAKRHKLTLVVEPARDDGALKTGRYGIARYRIRTEGVPAHAGARHADGRSAIREMAHQILAIEGMTDYERNITLNVGNIAGGKHVNVVPVHCEAQILALVPGPADEQEVLERLLGLKPVNPDVKVEVERFLFRPSFEMSAEGRKLYDHAVMLAREIGFDPDHFTAGGGSDGNFTGALGVPTLDGLGMVGSGPHTEHEHILFSSIEPRTRLLYRLFETLE